MKNLSIGILVLFFVVVLSGCFNQRSSDYPAAQPLKVTDKNKNQANENKASELEKTAPETTNDVPTAINESEKDLQLIDQDLQEIDRLDTTEENLEF